MQRLLKKLIRLVKSTLDVQVKYNSTYIRINFPSGKKWAWIDTLENQDYFRLRFHDVDEKGEENFKELKGFAIDALYLESKKGNDYSTVLIKDEFDLHDPRFIDFLKRKYDEYKYFYEEGIDIRNIKQEFFDTLGDEYSLHHYQKAYIILLLKAFFELTDENGKADFDEVADYFREFYLDRKKKGFQVENNPDARIENIEESTLHDIKYIIRTNPLNTKTLENFLSLQDNKIVMNNYLWGELDRKDIYQIRYIVNKQLAKYFNERVDGDSMAIPDVSREEIEKALYEFDQKLRSNDRWKNFNEKKNHKYVIKYNERLYPVKQIISMATGAHVSTYNSIEAVKRLKNKGFEIIEIDKTYPNELKDRFEYTMDNYVEARKHQEFAGHELGDLFRNEIPGIIKNYLNDFEMVNSDDYIVKGSIGQGNWARVPWIAILDKNITTTTQEGVYVVYLFSQDMNRMYLTLNQGVTNTSKEELIATRDKLREEMELPLKIDNNIDLSASGIGSDYELSTIGYIVYEKDSLPGEEVLIEDLERVMNIYREYKVRYIEDNTNLLSVEETLEHIKEYIKSQGFSYPPGLIEDFYLSLKTKPFVLLAGISGTGKTKLVELFARAIGCSTDNGRYNLIPVKPDWSDGSDLLGYNDIKNQFQPGPMIDIIKKASQDRENIYFVCLDEMNLARVEYYFSDFLSIMESRRKRGDLIKTNKLLTETDIGDPKNREKYTGLRIPDNLYIIGTVNMDETTHPFSKKVLDRANTIEFSEVNLTEYNLNDGDAFVEPLDGISNDFLKAEYITLKDCNKEDEEIIKEVIGKLQEVNNILEKANLHVGYRVRDELVFYMLYNKRYELLDFDGALDFQLMQKILPRIQGSSSAINRVLRELFSLASGKYYPEEDINIGDKAIDYVENNDIGPYPRSAKKLADMIKRMEEDRFTAYWL